jgi:hypothetical protein
MLSCVFYPKPGSDTNCDRTTSEIRALSPKIISGDSRRSENAQTHTHKHTVPNMKFKLKLIQIKCHVLEFTKDKVQNVLHRIIRVFAEVFVSHDRHTLFALEDSEPPRMTYTCESCLGKGLVSSKLDDGCPPAAPYSNSVLGPIRHDMQEY